MNLRLFHWCLCSMLLAPLPAFAQIPQTGLVVKIGDSLRLPTTLPVYINAAQCQEDMSLEVTFPLGAGSGATIPAVELWVAPDGIRDCGAPEDRRPTTGTLRSACWRVASVPGPITPGKRVVVQPVPASAVFDYDRNHECDADVVGAVYSLYVLPLSSPSSTDDVAPSLVANSLKATFTLYTKRPEAPSHLSGE